MKKGFSLVMMMGVVIISLMLVTIVSIKYFNTMDLVNFKKFSSELFMIQDKIDEYIFINNKMPIKEEILFDLKNISPLSSSQFDGCEKENDLIKFYVIDFKELDIVLNKRGFNKENNDIYVYSLSNNQVYYLKGIKYNKHFYYTFDEEMYKCLGISKVN